MPCIDENLAIGFLSGRLTDAAERGVDRHMDECAECLCRMATLARAEPASRMGRSGGVLEDGLTAADTRLTGQPTEFLRRGATVGRYVVLDLVGAGAMGTVYAAADPVLRRTVALKVLRPGTGDPRTDDATRLLREARNLARVSHPNVVAVHDVGTFGDRVVLAMELVEGQSLREWLGTPRSTAEILAVFLDAGRGIAAAHAAGVVHRDFKPDNVLVGSDGRVVVTDFGLAHAITTDDEPLLGPTAVVGTPAYMAPEQSRGVTDARADQFSYCVALHEALHGSRARPGTHGSVRGRSVPGPVRRAIRRGLAASPAERFPSMEALLAELTRDRLRAVRRYGIVALALLAVVSVLGHRAIAERRAIAACHARDPRLDALWNPARKAEAQAAFVATKTSYASDSWRTVEAALDRYAADWTRGTALACEQSRVRHEGSPAVRALSVACFDERLEEIRAVSDLLAAADAVVVRNASTVVRQLGPLDRCSDERALLALPPPKAGDAARVAQLRAALARSRALRDGGRMNDALALVQRTADESLAVDYLPTRASALVELGLLQSRIGDKIAADATMAQAARVADAAHDDGARVRALSQRLFIHGNVLKNRDKVVELETEAASALARLGEPDAAVAEAYHYNVGMAYRGLGDFTRAVVEIERSVLLAEKAYGPDGYDVARALSGLCIATAGRGDVPAAIPFCERSTETFRGSLGPNHPDYGLAVQNLGAMRMAVDDLAGACPLLEEGARVGAASLGPEHLQTINAESNLGACLAEWGDTARGITLLEGALRSRERILGASHLDVAHTLTRLGRAYLAADDAGHALPVLERADRIRGAAKGVSAADRAETSFAFARALWDGGGDRRRARALARRALGLLDEEPPANDPRSRRERRDLERWLAARPTS